MPDDRLLHRRQGLSAKLDKCDHLTYRVWTQYLLSADDFGLMVNEAAAIRGANVALMRESETEIRRCLDVLLSLGLVEQFVHQDQSYLCSLEWQDFQKVSYPRRSYLPDPPPEVFAKFSPKTRQLFRKHKKAKAGDGLRLTANGYKSTSPSSKKQGEPEGEWPLEPADVVTLWNETTGTCDIPKALDAKGTRLKKLLARLAEYPDRPWWVEYFARITRSDFLAGRTPRTEGHESWRPDFDWALEPKNLTKVIEGKFDNRAAVETFSASELAKAAEVLRKSFGGRCPHTGSCETKDECLRNLVRGWREKGGA